MFGSRLGYSWPAYRMALFPVGANPRSWKFSSGHIPATVHPIQFVFGSRVKVYKKIMHKE